MQCERCNGEVTWRGPFSALTHTECSSCGGINCQRIAAVNDNDEQAAFEDWLARTCPSGDVESVHRQWVDSYEYDDLLNGTDAPVLPDNAELCGGTSATNAQLDKDKT